MLFENTCKYIEESGIGKLLSDAGYVIVGFSGGADSTVLLSFFISQREKYPNLKIIAAHVNHMIRGEEADRDRIFCENFCRENVIDFEKAEIDVPALAKESGKGIEEAARDARYAFFNDLRIKYNGALIATAHNADDNLETLLLNLTRGSGSRGMGAIAPVRDGIFIRPLLFATSSEIRRFAKGSGISYVTDSTNANTEYTRNAVRASIVPALKRINPGVCSAALRLSAAAREDCDFIEKEAEKVLKGKLTRSLMRTLHPALFQRVLLFMYREATGKTQNLSRKNTEDCKKAVFATESLSIDLPGGYCFFADKDTVGIIKKAARQTPERAPLAIPVTEDKVLSFGDYFLLFTKKEEDINIIEENIYNLSLHSPVDCDKITGKLFVRTRLPGDTLRIGKMQKKLKKLLCDKGVPQRLRDSLPIICDGEGILYVPLVGSRDGCSADSSSKRQIYIYIWKRSRS